MKIKLLLFVFLFVSASFTVRAQYYPLVDTGKVWTSTECAYGWSISCDTKYYKLDQDTIIGSFTYKGVWHSSDSGLVNPNWYLQGVMREDAAKKSITSITVIRQNICIMILTLPQAIPRT